MSVMHLSIGFFVTDFVRKMVGVEFISDYLLTLFLKERVFPSDIACKQFPCYFRRAPQLSQKRF